jgi:hypothetical protein
MADKEYRIPLDVGSLLLSEKEVTKKSFRNCNAQVDLPPRGPEISRDLILRLDTRN